MKNTSIVVGLGPALIALLCALAGCAITQEFERPPAHLIIAFCNDTGLSAQVVARLEKRIAAHHPHLTWRRVPDADTQPGSRWLAAPPASPATKGLIHITRLAPAKAHQTASPEYLALLQNLSAARDPWKIVLMERSLFFPQADRPRLTLARLFERHGVALVISSDGSAYTRSVAIGANPAAAVRYLVVGNPAGAPAQGAAPTTAFSTATPCYIILHVFHDRLLWTAYDADETILDILSVARENTSATSLSILEIMAEENKNAKR